MNDRRGEVDATAIQSEAVFPSVRRKIRGDVVTPDGVVVRSGEYADFPDTDAPPLREPHLMPAEWVDPADLDPNKRKAAVKKVVGRRASDQTARLHQSNPNLITARHVKAAERIQGWRLRSEGRSQRCSLDFSSGTGSGDRPIVGPDYAKKERDALGIVLDRGGSVEIVRGVVLENRSPRDWDDGKWPANSRGRRRGTCAKRLAIALEILADFFEDSDRTKLRAAGIEPTCVGYDGGDPEVTDIPQNQIGRWDRAPSRWSRETQP